MKITTVVGNSADKKLKTVGESEREKMSKGNEKKKFGVEECIIEWVRLHDPMVLKHVTWWENY